MAGDPERSAGCLAFPETSDVMPLTLSVRFGHVSVRNGAPRNTRRGSAFDRRLNRCSGRPSAEAVAPVYQTSCRSGK